MLRSVIGPWGVSAPRCFQMPNDQAPRQRRPRTPLFGIPLEDPLWGAVIRQAHRDVNLLRKMRGLPPYFTEDGMSEPSETLRMHDLEPTDDKKCGCGRPVSHIGQCAYRVRMSRAANPGFMKRGKRGHHPPRPVTTAAPTPTNGRPVRVAPGPEAVTDIRSCIRALRDQRTRIDAAIAALEALGDL